MTSRPIDKPMARAQAHLAAGRYAEAVGAFRAVLGIDSAVVPARLGLADALAARGQRGAAVEGLVEAAERCTEREQHDHALLLYGKALALDPERLHLHLDVAVVERAMGHHHAAVARVEGLAERYMGLGRTDEAAEILRFAASWEADEVEPEEVEADEACTVIAANPLTRARAAGPTPRVQTETVVCATVLIRPDGSLWLGPAAGAPAIDEAELTVARAVSAPLVIDEREEADPDMVTRVASLPVRSAQDTLPTRPRSLRLTPPPRPTPGPRPTPATVPARTAGRPPVSTATRRPAEPTPAQTTVPARPVARPPVPTATRRPAEPTPVQAPARSQALVERLRQRAGLAAEAAESGGSVGAPTAAPKAAQSTKAGTEPIMIRRPILGRPDRDDEVTNRFRTPPIPRSRAAC